MRTPQQSRFHQCIRLGRSSLQNINNSTETTLVFDRIIMSRGGFKACCAAGTGLYTGAIIPEDGYYSAYAAIAWNADGLGSRVLYIRSNDPVGNNRYEMEQGWPANPTGGYSTSQSVSVERHWMAGTLVYVNVLHSSTTTPLASLETTANGNRAPALHIQRLD